MLGINKYLKMSTKMKGNKAKIVNKFLTTRFCDFNLTGKTFFLYNVDLQLFTMLLIFFNFLLENAYR